MASLLTTLIALFLANIAVVHGNSILYQCSMWGDPQLVQFPTNDQSNPMHTFCYFEGHAILYRSSHALVSVRSSRLSSDLVLDFNIILFNNDSVPICTVNAVDFAIGNRFCDAAIVIEKRDQRSINVQYRNAQFSAWIQSLGSHYKLTLFTTLPHITNPDTSGMCVQGCTTRSVGLRSIDRTLNMTDAQIITSALASKVCDLFISQTMSTLPPMTRSNSGFVSAVRQGCISDVTLTGDTRFVGEGIENIVADAIIQGGTVSVEDISQLVDNASSIAAQASLSAERDVENLVAAATWPCEPDVPVCVMPFLVRNRAAAMRKK